MVEIEEIRRQLRDLCIISLEALPSQAQRRLDIVMKDDTNCDVIKEYADDLSHQINTIQSVCKDVIDNKQVDETLHVVKTIKKDIYLYCKDEE